jgi:LIM and senescent cell antigen-like-containing domain protein 1/2
MSQILSPPNFPNVSSSASVNCPLCKEVCDGAYLEVNGTKYHNDCFRCYHCLEPFNDSQFVEMDGEFYCEADHSLLFSPRCAGCKEVINGKCVNALDQKWHVEHFVWYILLTSQHCERPLVGTNFVKKDDRPYCKQCPTDRKPNKRIEHDICDQCKLPIKEKTLVFRGLKYHTEHFRCFQCQGKLDHRCQEFQGELYCFQDYEKLSSKVCHACKLPILGVSVSAMGKMYHLEHFVCSQCSIPFNGQPHFEFEGKPFCELHFKQVTGAFCPYCRKAVKGAVINALGGSWCPNHFQCMGCFLNLSDVSRTKFMDFDSKPFCGKCFDKLPGHTRTNMKKYKEKEKEYGIV